MVITVGIYKEIRKMRLEGMSQRQIAAMLQISRNTVRNIGTETVFLGRGRPILGNRAY